MSPVKDGAASTAAVYSPDERRKKILAEAAEIFFEEGYEGACIDDLIQRVGGSKRTIYNEFGNKEGLFAAMITEIVTEHQQHIRARLEEDEKAGVSLREAALDYGRELLAIITSPRALALYRITIAEGLRFPNLAKAFYEAGPLRCAGRFAQLLEGYRDRGDLRVQDCLKAADHFSGLIRDNSYLGVLMGMRPGFTPEEAEAHVSSAVDVFLQGIQAKA